MKSHSHNSAASAKRFSREQLQNASAAWESFLRAYNRANRALIAEGSFAQLPMREYDVLRTLASASRPMTQSELLDAVVLSQPALSRMLGRMESAGLIRRERHCDDGRASLFSLTPEGRRAQRCVGLRHGVAVAELLYGALNEDEVRQLGELTSRLCRSEEEQR